MVIGKPTAGDAPWTSTGNAMIDQINSCEFQGSVVGRQLRVTDSSTFTTTSIAILMCRAPVKNGRTYRIGFYGECVASGAAGAFTIESRLLHRTDDVDTVTGSAALSRAESRNDSTAGVPRTVVVEGFFHAAADGFLRVGLWSARVEGAVTCVFTAAAIGSGPTVHMYIQDCGLTVAADGTIP